METPSPFICKICMDAMVDPVLVRSCYHNFCRSCVVTLLKRGNAACPVCKKAIELDFPEPIIRDWLVAEKIREHAGEKYFEKLNNDNFYRKKRVPSVEELVVLRVNNMSKLAASMCSPLHEVPLKFEYVGPSATSEERSSRNRKARADANLERRHASTQTDLLDILPPPSFVRLFKASGRAELSVFYCLLTDLLDLERNKVQINFLDINGKSKLSGDLRICDVCYIFGWDQASVFPLKFTLEVHPCWQKTFIPIKLVPASIQCELPASKKRVDETALCGVTPKEIVETAVDVRAESEVLERRQSESRMPRLIIRLRKRKLRKGSENSKDAGTYEIDSTSTISQDDAEWSCSVFPSPADSVLSPSLNEQEILTCPLQQRKVPRRKMTGGDINMATDCCQTIDDPLVKQRVMYILKNHGNSPPDDYPGMSFCPMLKAESASPTPSSVVVALPSTSEDDLAIKQKHNVETTQSRCETSLETGPTVARETTKQAKTLCENAKTERSMRIYTHNLKHSIHFLEHFVVRRAVKTAMSLDVRQLEKKRFAMIAYAGAAHGLRATFKPFVRPLDPKIQVQVERMASNMHSKEQQNSHA